MTQITYGSVCSGIEAASVAWEPLGWKPLWFSEIEPFPSAVLSHHWPQVPNLGDFTDIRHKLADGTVEAPDVALGTLPGTSTTFSPVLCKSADSPLPNAPDSKASQTITPESHGEGSRRKSAQTVPSTKHTETQWPYP